MARITDTEERCSKEAHTNFFLIRHGNTDYNVENKVQGHLPIKLNHKGRLQAAKVGRFLKCVAPKVDAILCSPVLRGLETGDIIHSTSYPDSKKIIDKAFAEIDFGYYVNQKIDNISTDLERMKVETWGDKKLVDVPFPQGESFTQATDRIVNGCIEYSSLGRNIVIATHSQLIEAFLVHLKALEYKDVCSRGKNKNCTVSKVIFFHKTKTFIVEYLFLECSEKNS